MGGSLGMAIRRRGMADSVVGLGRARKRLEPALTLGAVDEITTDPAEALAGADALVVCIPPRLIRKKWAELNELLAPGAFVTDVGSAKAALVAEAETSLPESALFVGSHPMAGSEKTGVEAARGDLFEHACCFVTPTDNTPLDATSLAVRFWKALGSRVTVMHPERHDHLIASISHLPHLLAVSLVENLYAGGDSTLLFRSVLGQGFRDTTRIAAGDAQMWEQIFAENAPALVENIDQTIRLLTEWKELLSRPDGGSEIIEHLTAAAAQRNQLAAEDSNNGPPK